MLNQNYKIFHPDSMFFRPLMRQITRSLPTAGLAGESEQPAYPFTSIPLSIWLWKTTSLELFPADAGGVLTAELHQLETSGKPRPERPAGAEEFSSSSHSSAVSQQHIFLSTPVLPPLSSVPLLSLFNYVAIMQRHTSFPRNWQSSDDSFLSKKSNMLNRMTTFS